MTALASASGAGLPLAEPNAIDAAFRQPQSLSDATIRALLEGAEEILAELCCGGFSVEEDALVITETEAPYAIIHVNDAWCQMCQYSRLEADGNTCAMLQGPKTDRSVVDRLLQLAHQGEVAGAYVHNYKADGSLFMSQIQIARVPSRDGRPACFAAKLQEIKLSDVARRCKEAVGQLKRVHSEAGKEEMTERDVLLSALAKRRRFAGPVDDLAAATLLGWS